jgi:hypothetical protein
VLPRAKEQVPVPNHPVHWPGIGWAINVSHGCRGKTILKQSIVTWDGMGRGTELVFLVVLAPEFDDRYGIALGLSMYFV